MTISELERLQIDIADFLLSHKELQFVSITRTRPRDSHEALILQGIIEKSLSGLMVRNGRRGVAALIVMPGIEGMEGNTRTLNGETVLAIDVIENLMINEGADGTGASCEVHALMIAKLLQHQAFYPCGPLVAAAKLITPIAEAVLDKKVMYRVHFTTTFSAERIEKVPSPSISEADAIVTLACSLEGAAIYYTLDGTFPGEGNAEAIPYSEPFTLPVGTTHLRYGAYKEGMAGSHTAMAVVVAA